MYEIPEGKEIINAKELTLQEWLDMILSGEDKFVFPEYTFPTDAHRNEYLKSAHERDDESVSRLLEYLLLPSCSLGVDEGRINNLLHDNKHNPELFNRKIKMQTYKRLVRYEMGLKSIPPWEGITWVMDLLPHFPKQALEALNAYILAHWQFLPDGRLDGLIDAVEIIRARFIGLPGTVSEKINLLQELNSRSFEHLVEQLYKRMNYETELTPAQKDGGRDVIAIKKDVARLEHLRIECKRYNKPVGVRILRELLGVVSDEKANKGVLVTTSSFTRDAIKIAQRNPRLELINGEQLVMLLNEHLGSLWTVQIDRYISDRQRESPPL